MKSVKPQQRRRALPYAIAAVLLIVAPTAAQANFSGPYATPGNWTFSNGSQDGVAANGEVDLSSAPGSITIIGGDDGSFNLNTDFTIPAAGTGFWSFDFSWDNQDNDPLGDGPIFDFGGFLHNGVFTEFGGADASSGQLPISVPVVLGDTIGYRVNCTDCLEGPGVLTISKFSAPVDVVSTPEPGTLILVALGAAGLAVGRLRRRVN